MSAGAELAAAGITDPALRDSYRRARRSSAQHGRTYYLATLLLPPAKRPYVHALYGFARHVDDLVDESAAGPQRAAELEDWVGTFQTDLEWGATSDPIVRAVLHTVARWQIPHSYFADFITSMRADLSVTSYATYADLAEYMWGSACVIGLQMLPILGRRDEQTRWDQLEAPAQELATAFQLTNFLRDVAEDLARGRVYLPQESLDQFGVDRDRLARGRVDEPIRNLFAWEIERARGHYRAAEPGLELVHPSSRDCLATALMLYERILDEIEARDYDVFSARVTVPLRTRALVGTAGWQAARRARSEPTGTGSSGSARSRTARLLPERMRSANR